MSQRGICIDCGSETTGPKFLRCKSCSNKHRAKDPEWRIKQASILAAMCRARKGDPVFRENCRKAAIKKTQSPEWKRNNIIAVRAMIPKRSHSPRWQAAKQRISQSLKEYFSIPENRQQLRARVNSPENISKHSGSNSATWQGGKSFEPYGIEFNRRLKSRIRQRDGFQCQRCGEPENGKAHDCHHIDYDKHNNTSLNLVTLCHPCHMRMNMRRDYWIDYFQSSQNPAIESMAV